MVPAVAGWPAAVTVAELWWIQSGPVRNTPDVLRFSWSMHAMVEQRLYLIAGLGNPGRKYAANRHNAGYCCVQRLARAHRLSFDTKQKNSLVSRGQIKGMSVILALPQTYMNRSGLAVQALAQFYKIPLDHLLVVYDDLDLLFGSLRLRKAGSSGGHKGVESIIERLGNDRSFPRLRVGIGRPPGHMDPAAYVLRDFDPDELPLLDEVLEQAVSAVEVWLADGIEAAMTRFN